jgi:integrase
MLPLEQPFLGATVVRVNLTDRFIKSRPAAPAGERTDYGDALVPGLVLRVTDRGHKSFALRARYPLQPTNPTRRLIGEVGAISLEQARQKAREWLELIGKGIDPKIEAERQKAAAHRRQANTFACVAQDFLDQHVVKLAKSAEAERIIKGEFVRRWAGRPITDIAPIEVSAAILAIVKRGAPYQARNSFSLLRLLFNWAIGQGSYGIDASPLERLSVKALCGASEARERILTDAELRAVWNATGEMGFPYGPCFRMLILTGAREREIADMSWGEVGEIEDVDKAMLTIPAARTKSDRAHEIPLAPVARDLLKSLPCFSAGDSVFTTTAGKKSINGFSKAKARIDRLSGVASWKIHDLRRTMRTHLSALPVQDMVRELVIGHAKKGLHKIYDQHSYQTEKRHCLELWEKRLLAIVEPPPPQVADLEKERAKRVAV